MANAPDTPAAPAPTLWNSLVKPAVVLVLICAIVGFLLGSVDNLTLPTITANREARAWATYNALIPEATDFEALPCVVPGVTACMEATDDLGYAVIAQSKGYSSQVPMAVAFDDEGTITNVIGMDNTETPGLGTKVQLPDFTDQFLGRTPDHRRHRCRHGRHHLVQSSLGRRERGHRSLSIRCRRGACRRRNLDGEGSSIMAAIDQKPSALSVFSKGLLIENPTLRQMLGLCPTLAVTTAVTNGIGMGVATTFVLVCSGIVVSLLRNIIPTTMRLPAFITVIAGFVTIVMMVVEAYLPDLNQALGIYLPLIVVNCIVLGRAEVFASKHPVKDAALDGLGMGAGFTLTLVLMSAIRELLGAGTLLGFPILLGIVEPMTVFIMPPGGFAVLGVLIAISVVFEMRRKRRAGEPEDEAIASQEDVCASCQMCDLKEREA